MGYHMTWEMAIAMERSNPEVYQLRIYINRHDGGCDTNAGRKYGVWDKIGQHWVEANSK